MSQSLEVVLAFDFVVSVVLEPWICPSAWTTLFFFSFFFFFHFETWGGGEIQSEKETERRKSMQEVV